MHFLEIIKQHNNFKKHQNTKQRMAFLPKLKNAWLPVIFFSDSNNPWQDLLFPCSHKPRKNYISGLGRHHCKKRRHHCKKPNFLWPSWDAQNVCAVAKGGTVLNMFLHVLQDASYTSPTMSDTESASMTLEAGSCNPSVGQTHHRNLSQ